MNVLRRTFAARAYPPGSAERARLNRNTMTSEYMPSHRYALAAEISGAVLYIYRTKAEAVEAAQELAP